MMGIRLRRCRCKGLFGARLWVIFLKRFKNIIPTSIRLLLMPYFGQQPVRLIVAMEAGLWIPASHIRNRINRHFHCLRPT